MSQQGRLRNRNYPHDTDIRQDKRGKQLRKLRLLRWNMFPQGKLYKNSYRFRSDMSLLGIFCTNSDRLHSGIGP